MILTSKANAKINLFLKICGIYPEGYHRLFMLMQEISLGDEITIEFGDTNSNPEISIQSEADCPPEKDLCYKAARRYYDEIIKNRPELVSKLCNINIIEEKNTPSKAGLGGGSSDAAVVIKLLQEYYDSPFSLEELIKMATSLGADVPFFLVGGSCFCEGIGEIITELPSLRGLPLLLVKPNEGVPTGPCFKLSDSKQMPFDEEGYKKSMETIFGDSSLTPIGKIEKAREIMVNDLQMPAIELVPVISDILDELNKTAPVFAAMSGSGSCVYAIYSDFDALNEAYENFNRSLFPDCFILKCQTL